MSNQNNNNTNEISGTDSAAAAGGADQPSGAIPIVHQPNSRTSLTNYNNVPQSTDGNIINMYNNTIQYDPQIYLMNAQQQQQQQFILAQQQYAQQQAQQQQIMQLGIRHMQERQQIQSMCRGITIFDVRTSSIRSDINRDTKGDTERGFHHLVGNALRQQATHRSNNNGEWESPSGYTINGYIMNPNTNNPTWQCIEVDGVVGFRKVGQCSGSRAWNNITGNWDGHCTKCHDIGHDLYKLCRNEVDLRANNNVFGGSFNQMRAMSPTLVEEKLKSQSKELHILQKKQLRNKLTISLLREREKIEVPHCPEYLFGNEEEWKKKYKAIMESESDIEKKEIFDLLFEEMVVVRNRKKKYGSHHGHVYSPLFIMHSVW